MLPRAKSPPKMPINDTYGRWLPKGNKAAIDSLDDPCTEGTPEVRGGDFGPATPNFDVAAKDVPEEFRELITNGPCWTRTSDPLLKSTPKLTVTTSQRHLTARPRRRWR